MAPRAGFRAFQVVEVLGRPATERGRPRTIRVDDGPGFAGRPLDRRAHLNGVEPGFPRPGKRADDAPSKASDARFRQGRLNASWFLSMAGARDRLEGWRCDHNDDRPRSALGNSTPRASAAQARPDRRAA
jgi:putative transposase